MLSYCLRYKKTQKVKNTKVARTKNGKTMLLLKFAVCDKRFFISKQTAKSLRLKNG